MKPWLFSVSVKPVPFLRRWMRLFWTESHIAGDRDTGKRPNARPAPGPSVDSRPNSSRRARTGRKKHSPMSRMRLFAALKSLNSLGPQNRLYRLPQTAEVISAACHITQTKPPHDASDNVSRTQRAMTASLACSAYVLCCGFVLVKGRFSSDTGAQSRATLSERRLSALPAVRGPGVPVMAKGQVRSNKETRKPKAEKPKPAVSVGSSPFTTPPGKK